MSSPYLEETFHPFLETRGGRPAVTWVTEREPLGTGGAIVSVLDRLGDEPFLALNGDILTDLDLTAMLDRHRSRSAAVTIALHRVEDARAFGLVATDSDRPRHRVPGEAAGSDPRGHQRRNVCPRPLRAPRLGPRDVPLDRGRDLPVPDRRGRADARVRAPTRIGWTSGRRSSTSVRTPTSWPAGSPAMPTTLPGSVRALVWIPRHASGGPSRSGPTRGSRPTPRSTERCSSPVRSSRKARGSCARCSDPGRPSGPVHRSPDPCSATVSGWAPV